jgi:succinate dehydrogenase / fumarate reductase membrane anchor subunit
MNGQDTAGHGGLGHWLWQRVSSLVLIPLTVWLLWAITRLAGADYASATQFFSHPFNAGLAILMTAVVAFHAQTGIQVICEDYIAQPWQSLLIWLTRIACFGGLVLMAWAILGIAGSSPP